MLRSDKKKFHYDIMGQTIRGYCRRPFPATVKVEVNGVPCNVCENLKLESPLGGFVPDVLPQMRTCLHHHHSLINRKFFQWLIELLGCFFYVFIQWQNFLQWIILMSCFLGLSDHMEKGTDELKPMPCHQVLQVNQKLQK